jgi:hypothetical protein
MFLVDGESGWGIPGVAGPLDGPRMTNSRKLALMKLRLSTEREPVLQVEEVLSVHGRVALLDGRLAAKEILIRHLLNDGLVAKWTEATGRSSLNIEFRTSGND